MIRLLTSFAKRSFVLTQEQKKEIIMAEALSDKIKNLNFSLHSPVSWLKVGCYVLAAWIIISLVWIGAFYALENHKFHKSQQRFVAELTLKLNKKIDHVADMVTVSSERIQAIDSDDVKQTSKRIQNILFSTHQLAYLSNVGMECKFSFTPFNNPKTLVTRFGVVENIEHNIPHEYILANPGKNIILKQGTDLVFYQPVQDTTEQPGSWYGIVMGTMPVPEIGKLVTWDLYSVDDPEFMELSDNAKETLRQDYGQLPENIGSHNWNEFIHLKNHDQLLCFHLKQNLGCKKFIDLNQFEISLIVCSILLILLAGVITYYFLLQQPLRLYRTKLEDLKQQEEELLGELTTSLEKNMATEHLTQLMQSSYKAYNKFLDKLQRKQLAVLDQVRESIVIITQTLAGENDLNVTDKDLVRLGVSACKLLDYTPNAIASPLQLQETNLIDSFDSLQTLFAVEIYQKQIHVKIDATSPVVLTTDPHLLSLLLVNLFHRSLLRLPADHGKITVKISDDKNNIQVKLIDNGYAVGDKIAAFESPQEKYDHLKLEDKAMVYLVKQLGGSLKIRHETRNNNQTVLTLPLTLTKEEPKQPDNVVNLFHT